MIAWLIGVWHWYSLLSFIDLKHARERKFRRAKVYLVETRFKQIGFVVFLELNFPSFAVEVGKNFRRVQIEFLSLRGKTC